MSGLSVLSIVLVVLSICLFVGVFFYGIFHIADLRSPRTREMKWKKVWYNVIGMATIVLFMSSIMLFQRELSRGQIRARTTVPELMKIGNWKAEEVKAVTITVDGGLPFTLNSVLVPDLLDGFNSLVQFNLNRPAYLKRITVTIADVDGTRYVYFLRTDQNRAGTVDVLFEKYGIVMTSRALDRIMASVMESQSEEH